MKKSALPSWCGRVYLGAVILAGTGLAGYSAKEVYFGNGWSEWWGLAALTLLTGVLHRQGSGTTGSNLSF
jgi:hypothetical protein